MVLYPPAQESQNIKHIQKAVKWDSGILFRKSVWWWCCIAMMAHVMWCYDVSRYDVVCYSMLCYVCCVMLSFNNMFMLFCVMSCYLHTLLSAYWVWLQCRSGNTNRQGKTHSQWQWQMHSQSHAQSLAAICSKCHCCRSAVGRQAQSRLQTHPHKHTPWHFLRQSDINIVRMDNAGRRNKEA